MKKYQMTTKGIIDSINIIDKQRYDEILCGFVPLDDENKKEEAKWLIKGLSSESDKKYEYLSEFLTNIIYAHETSSKSILYKPIDSTGFDGAFITKIDGQHHIFINEVKSSNSQYDVTSNNFVDHYINEAYRDFFKKYNNTKGEKRSSSRKEDNSTIYDRTNLFISKEMVENNITENEKETLISELERIVNYESPANLILSTLSKKPTIKTKEEFKKSIIAKGGIQNLMFSILISPATDIDLICNALIKKVQDIYGVTYEQE